MALNLEAKKNIIQQVNSLASNAISIGVAEYRGLNVEQMTDLRSRAFEAKVSLQVVKNTLAKKALVKTGCECVLPILSGPVILGFSQDEPGAVARVFNDFTKENKDLIVKGLGVEGEFIISDKLTIIAGLPTKNQAISLMIATILAPISKLASTLNEIPTKATRVISRVADEKQLNT